CRHPGGDVPPPIWTRAYVTFGDPATHASDRGVALAVGDLPGRLPVSMSLIGMLTLVTVQTGSVAAAGLLSGAFALGETFGGPVIARFADRHGQRVPVLVMALVDAVLICALVVSVLAEAPMLLLLAQAASAGMC